MDQFGVLDRIDLYSGADTKRLVCWFSCGAASAVATKMALVENARRTKPLPAYVVRTWIKEEHPDNDRFMRECEAWFGVPVTVIKNEKYGGSTHELFRRTGFIATPAGAYCTRELKKAMCHAFLQPGDLQVWGFTSEEQDRFDRLIDANNDFRVWSPLISDGLSHADTLGLLERAGIELPVLYRMGYEHNNCIGCVKAGAGYWNKIRVDFPEQFEAMAQIEEANGAKLIKLVNGRVSLRELDPHVGYLNEPSIQCGIACELVEQRINQGDE